MANDFSTDPNCKALWRLENAALTADSKGGNTLTNSGVVAVTAAGSYQEGAASGDFESTESDYMDIADASLDAGFPLKNGDANKKISLCFWMKPESLPASGNWTMMVTKYATNKKSFYVALYNVGTHAHVQVAIGYAGGASAESLQADSMPILAGQWYHVGVTFQDSDKAWKVRIWGATETWAGDNSGTAVNNINVEDAPWRLGAHGSGGYNFDGLLDEVVVFSDILTLPEIDRIRNGTYGPAAKATNPSPVDDATGVLHHASLSWTDPGAMTMTL